MSRMFVPENLNVDSPNEVETLYKIIHLIVPFCVFFRVATSIVIIEKGEDYLLLFLLVSRR